MIGGVPNPVQQGCRPEPSPCWRRSGRRRPPSPQEPGAPEAVGSVPARTTAVGCSPSLDLAPYFADADDDPLTYAAPSSNPAVAAVSVSGSVLSIAGLARGARRW